MKLPDSFKNALKKKEQEEQKEREEERNKELEEKEISKRYNNNEKQLLSEKITLCKKLFLWREQFLSTNEGINLFKREGYSISVFGKKYDYEQNSNKVYHFPLHSLRITDKGITYAVRNSCWGEMKYEYNHPEKLAKNIPSKFLKQVCSLIQSGKVFKRMADYLVRIKMMLPSKRKEIIKKLKEADNDLQGVSQGGVIMKEFCKYAQKHLDNVVKSDVGKRNLEYMTNIRIRKIGNVYI